MRLANKIVCVVVLGLLFSFISIDAIVYSPGLAIISNYFSISSNTAGYTVTCYIIGCTLGQLLYGPLANFFGIKKCVRYGAILSILGAMGCIASYYLNSFYLLVLFRFVTALGAASGIKLTYTIVNKLFDPKETVSVMSLITMTFALLPNLGIFLGSILVSIVNWTGPFYLIIGYSLVIILTIELIPEVHLSIDKNALKIKSIFRAYAAQFKDKKIFLGGLIVGFGSSIAYVFTALAPFIAMQIMHLSPVSFGKYSLIPCIGKFLGAIFPSICSRRWSNHKAIKFGFFSCFIGTTLFILLDTIQIPLMLFLPMVFIYLGSAFIFSNIVAVVLKDNQDISNASAVMSFISMLFALIIVQGLVILKISLIIKIICTYWLLFLLSILWYLILSKLYLGRKT